MQLSETDRVTSLLTDYLDVQSRRAEIVAGNLANSDTPGFKAKELDFMDHLRAAAQNSITPRNAGGTAASINNSLSVVEQNNGIVGIDGNTVDAGREMSTLADAGMQFLSGTQMLQARFRTLRSAIREGR
jgi:flagellar basal-body rod protein FlgB